ncbi:MAG: hypothetical protein GPOALKHO_000367 [Sodalis sp.]|uniref:hypothetical protein n=1 Tax=Sodalis sp. (in: enterobacteria) TaxID=1898979 RepID=UPI0038734A39|nr:MAG: hypothetical protein GPOALKHO_000367 [Sodalis sp.]
MAGLTILTNTLDATRKLAEASEQAPGTHQVIVNRQHLSLPCGFRHAIQVGIDANNDTGSYDLRG